MTAKTHRTIPVDCEQHFLIFSVYSLNNLKARDNLGLTKGATRKWERRTQ